jgi:homoserine kinase, Neisseria type
MSVYTPVSEAELSVWLSDFALGSLRRLTPIAAGIENTNYFVTVDGGEFVLTLYERLPAQDLPFYLNLMVHFGQHGIPVPQPQKTRHGDLFKPLNGKPATLIEKVAGAPQMQPTVEHCRVIGATLARMHLAVADFAPTLDNPRGATWRNKAARVVRAFINAEQNALLEQELAAHHDFARALPSGAIHADLFRDNVLFVDPQQTNISGIIDFGFAATDAFLYDLAITVNDWCLAADHSGALDDKKLHALLTAYQQIRAVSSTEQSCWPQALRCAALRFWLSRLYDFYLPRDGALVHAHDPAHFERILRHHVSFPLRWPES